MKCGSSINKLRNKPSKMSNIAAEEYASSLSDLTINSKPLINMLTMLAEENLEHAPAIVQAVEKHLLQVQSDIKLPVLYLIDSIVKNVGRSYIVLFTQNIVSTFCSCFEKVDERTRAQMYKLRQTWNDVFPAKKLYAVDLRVSSIDPAWPITAPTPSTSIHVNPKFFAVPATPTLPVAAAAPPAIPVAPPPQPGDLDLDPLSVGEIEMRDQLLRKQKELIELHQRKLTLELIQTKAKLEEQQKQLDRQTGMVQASQQLLQVPTTQRVSKESAQLIAVQKMIEVAALKLSDPRTVTTVARPQNVTTSIKPSESTLSIAPMKSRTRTASPTPPPKAHSKDPRLASRNQQTSVVESQGKTAAVVATDKLVEPSKSKPHITINLGCDNKSNVPNKEPRGLTKPDKVRNASKVCPPSNAVKNHGASKPKPLSYPPSSITSMKRIPKIKDLSKIVTVDLSGPGSPLRRESEDKVKIMSKKTSPNKISSPKKKSSFLEKNKSPPFNDKAKASDKDPALTSKRLVSPKKRSYDKKISEEVVKSSRIPVKPRDDCREGSKYEVVDSEGESRSPPSPPTITDAKKQDRSARFKDVKISAKGRNYVRRNQKGESRSRSPVKSDVDLRLNGPPEKLQKLMPVADMVKKPGIDAGIPVDTGKDVDLRQVPGAGSSLAGKKRASTDREPNDQPTVKKSRAEMFDVLFGNEDVDLRRLATTPAVTPPTQQPSPPPPPIISQRSPSSSPIHMSPRQTSAESPTRSDGKRTSSGKSSADQLKGNGEVALRNWSKFKGPISPLTTTHRDRHGHKPIPGKLDPLGRPFVFHRVSGEGGEEKRRYSSEDTDMRKRLSKDGHEDVDGNINIIIKQAQEQLENGQLSFSQYNTLLKQVIQMNEASKLREAQRREESWERRSMRSRKSDLSPASDDGSLDDRSAAFSPISDMSENRSPPRARAGDMDDRFRSSSTRHMPRGPRGVRPSRGRGPWQWERPQQQWARGVQGVRPMHPHQPYPRPSGSDGNYRWRQPNVAFINRPGYIPGPIAHPAGPPLHPSGPAVRPAGLMHPSGPVALPSGPAMHQSRPPVYAPGSSVPIAPAIYDADHLSRFERFSPIHDAYDLFGPHPAFDHTELPPADTVVLERIAQDTMRTMNIDGQPREIRFYGDTAIVMINWEDPREITFQKGTRRICFDDTDSFPVAFNDMYREFLIDGEPHQIRFGAPTRELYIDGKWYECYFSGSPINIEIDGAMHTVKLEGPPPQVKVGNKKRLDLCAGKINLIVNAMNMVPIYLDAKPQRFDIEGKPHILRFINALTTVLINGRPFDVEFGGLPKPIMVGGKKHFIRFSVLPENIMPGYLSIRNMEGGRLPSPPPHDTRRTSNGMKREDSILGEPYIHETSDVDAGIESVSRTSSPDQYSDEEVMPMTGVYINQKKTGAQMPLDMLTNLMPAALVPSSGFGYQVEPESHSQDGILSVKTEESAPAIASDIPKPISSFFPFVLPNINVDELFQKLVATGIVPTQADGESSQPSITVEPKKEEEPRIMRTVDFKSIETMRVRQPGLVAILYSGIQCSSCGVRFPPEETIKYSQHLDWHFRQNRRERDNTRKAQSRKWYYDVSDWIQFEEIEDLEHRAQSWFDVQQEALIGVEDSEPVVIPSVPIGERNSDDPFCVMCHDKFEQFYNEESEEWHLKMAIRVEDKLYHPLCYEDFKDASVEETLPEVKEEPSTEIESIINEEEVVEVKEEVICETEIKIEDMEVTMEVEDDIVELDYTPAQEVPSEDLTLQEDTGDIGSTEAELVVATILDDVLESAELQLFGPRVVKLEPADGQLDSGDNGVTVIEEPALAGPAADTTHTAVVSSIDGNVQFEEKVQQSTTTSGSKIKINITKPIQSREPQSEAESETVLDDSEKEFGLTPLERRTVVGEDSEPPPPGVETVPVPVMLKPKLQGRQLTVLPPVSKGVELSGLCSIM